MPELKSSSKLISKITSLFKLESVEKRKEKERIRKDLIMLANQIKSTGKIIKSNQQSGKFEGFTKEDQENMAKVISVSSSKSMDKLLDKALSRGDLSNSEGKELLESMDTMGDLLKQSDVQFDVKMSDVIDNLKPLVLDTRLDKKTRRDMLAEIKNVAEESGASTEAVERLDTIMNSGLNFDREQAEQLGNIFQTLSIDENLNRKSSFTLSELNRKFDSSVATGEEITELLDRGLIDGGKFREAFEKNASAFTQGVRGSGIVDLLLNNLGLGGFAPIITPILGLFGALGTAVTGTIATLVGLSGIKKVSGVVSGVGSLFSGKGKAGNVAAGGASKLFSGLSTSLKSVVGSLGSFAKGLGSAGLVAATAFAGFELGTFINKQIDKFFGEEGAIGKAVFRAFNDPDGMFNTLSTKISDFFKSITDGIPDISKVFTGLVSKMTSAFDNFDILPILKNIVIGFNNFIAESSLGGLLGFEKIDKIETQTVPPVEPPKEKVPPVTSEPVIPVPPTIPPVTSEPVIPVPPTIPPVTSEPKTPEPRTTPETVSASVKESREPNTIVIPAPVQKNNNPPASVPVDSGSGNVVISDGELHLTNVFGF